MGLLDTAGERVPPARRARHAISPLLYFKYRRNLAIEISNHKRSITRQRLATCVATTAEPKAKHLACGAGEYCRVVACLRASLFADADTMSVLRQRGKHSRSSRPTRDTVRISHLKRSSHERYTLCHRGRSPPAARTLGFTIALSDRSEDAGAFGLSTRLRRACRLPRGC